MSNRPDPVTDDRDTAVFFAAAGRGELVVVSCEECSAILHPPRGICHMCGSTRITTTKTNGRGNVYSWTVVAHQVHPAFETPYTIILVELEDHPEVRLIGHLDGEPAIAAGDPVEVTFTPLEGGGARPDWQLSNR